MMRKQHVYVLVWKPVQLHEVKNVSVLNSALVIVCNEKKKKNANKLVNQKPGGEKKKRIMIFVALQRFRFW